MTTDYWLCAKHAKKICSCPCCFDRCRCLCCYFLLYLLVVIAGIWLCWMCERSRRCNLRNLRGSAWSSFLIITPMIISVLIPRHSAVCFHTCICLVMFRCCLCMFIRKMRRKAYCCMKVGRRRKRRRKRLLCGMALLIGTFSTFTLFGLMWSSPMVPCMAAPLPRSIDASTLHRGGGLNWRGGAGGSAASGRKRNEKLLAGLSSLLQSMEGDEDQEEEDDAEEDLLMGLKNLVRSRPGNLLKALTELVARHSAAPSRPAETSDWTSVSRKKTPKPRQVVLRPPETSTC